MDRQLRAAIFAGESQVAIRGYPAATHEAIAAASSSPANGVSHVKYLIAAAIAATTLSAAPANAVVIDLSTMTCKQFIEGSDDTIKMVLTWMDGWYKGDSDEAIIDTDVFVENAKKFGTYCGKNPTMSIVNAAEAVLGK